MSFNFGTSVFKREAKSKDKVETLLRRKGWKETGSVGGKISYWENSGINITVIKGINGTVITPSGPVRGFIFGDDNKPFSSTSVIGAGADNDSGTKKSQMNGPRRTNDPMV